jgi:hypothetical protein
MLIYSYLTPNQSIKCGKHQRGPLRHDSKAGGGLLQVNRQIYFELCKLWYGSTIYHMNISTQAALFLDHLILPGYPCPSTFASVKKLHLVILFCHFWETETPKPIAFIGKLLSSGKCSLQYLDLELHAGTFLCAEVINSRKSHDEVLERNLRPLESVRGLCGVSTVVKFACVNFPTAATDEFIRKSRKYLDRLEKKMMMPSGEYTLVDDGSAANNSLILR